MENNFENEKEYSSVSNNSVKPVIKNSNNGSRKSLSILLLVLLILISSILGSLFTIYVAPKLGFFEKTPLYSKISSST